MPDAVDTMLGSRRAFAVAAAGCGKTELLGRIVADERSGRQLVLTHTHAGVAAIKKRLIDLRVPHEKYQLDTIAGWCLRYGAAYSGISGLRVDAEGDPDWDRTYPGAERVCRTSLGRRVFCKSYSGVLVDEYQDCSEKQHAVVRALAEGLPCRGVGDPLQSVFGFRGDPCVSWGVIQSEFEVLDGALTHPWRWQRPGRNAALGSWLVEARRDLEAKGRLELSPDAPVTWIRHDGDQVQAWAEVCRDIGGYGDTAVAVLKWTPQCIQLARRLGSGWPVVEKFDDPELLRLGLKFASEDGREIVAALFEFLAERITHLGTELRPIVEAMQEGRSTSRFTKHKDHAGRLEALAKSPTPGAVLAWLEGILANRKWWLYRPECVLQLRAALRECVRGVLSDVPDAVAAARTRARHRGRLTHRRTIGTPLLVKGLEFDHAVVLWEPAHLTLQGLYVAITRASKSLTIVSASRTLIPETR